MNIKYKQNMGILDRMLRFSMGAILIVYGIYLVSNTIGVVLIILSFPFLISGIIGFCPGYLFLGNIHKQKKQN